MPTDNTNPGNFANRSAEEVTNIASKGGQSSHSSGFASMDSDKQKDIASQGGHASGGSFEPVTNAREAGHREASLAEWTNQRSKLLCYKIPPRQCQHTSSMKSKILVQDIPYNMTEEVASVGY